MRAAWIALALCAACRPAEVADNTYMADTLACTAKAIAIDGGRAYSERCEAEVDLRWGVTTVTVLPRDGGAR